MFPLTSVQRDMSWIDERNGAEIFLNGQQTKLNRRVSWCRRERGNTGMRACATGFGISHGNRIDRKGRTQWSEGSEGEKGSVRAPWRGGVV